MKYLVNGRQMKEIDRISIEEYGLPSMVLMERAALAVADAVSRRIRPAGTVLSVCGRGNNGADAIAAARILSFRGYDCRILIPSGEGNCSREFLAQLEIAEKTGIAVEIWNGQMPGTFDAVIDGIFGTGLSRNVEGRYREMEELVGKIRNSHGDRALTVAVDMPSGISSDSGKVMGYAVRADVTVTFGEEKAGQVLFPGREFCGTLLVEEIGFPPGARRETDAWLMAYEPEDLCLVPDRPAYSNKGTFGKVLVAAGARNMAGAAYFSALAAYRCGAGLVKILTPEENRMILQMKIPEAVLSAFDTENAEEDAEAFERRLKKEISWADVIVLGPGLGREAYARQMTETILREAAVPVVMDADAVNLAAETPSIRRYIGKNVIMTPHMGEMARFTGKTVDEIREDLTGTAERFTADTGASCVLKDAASVISRSDGKIFINTSGSPAMAKGGSGDVLSGVIAGLTAAGMNPCEAASFGPWIHGLAGEEAAKRLGKHSVLAGELADSLCEILKQGMQMRQNHMTGRKQADETI